MNINKIANYILETLEIKSNDQKIYFVNKFGSYVYNSITTKSDLDLIYCFESDEDIYEVYQSKDYTEFKNLNIDCDLHYISSYTFQKLLSEHNIMALEVYYNLKNEEKKLFNFSLDLDLLRRRVSAVVSNSWSKARKKMELSDEDTYIGLKSLFHSIRILSFGINIAKDNKIDYLSIQLNNEKILCADLLNQILTEYKSGFRWKDFKEKYTPLQNSNATLFRILAPKKLD